MENAYVLLEQTISSLKIPYFTANLNVEAKIRGFLLGNFDWNCTQNSMSMITFGQCIYYFIRIYFS